MTRNGLGTGLASAAKTEFLARNWLEALECRPAQESLWWGRGGESVTGRLSKGLRAATISSIVIVVLAGGCDHPRSTPEDATPISYEVLHTLIGKQVTLRGKFSLSGKFGAYVMLDNQKGVYLVSKGSFTWGKPYTEMDGKLVEATGTLRFYHAPDAAPTDRAVARAPDYFYFEVETTQLRLISRWRWFAGCPVLWVAKDGKVIRDLLS
jgi:hypothetical protein